VLILFPALFIIYWTSLALAVYIKKGNKWRYKEKVSLNISENLPKGERILAILKLTPQILSLSKNDISKIGFGVVSDVEWQPGKILVAGSNEAVELSSFTSSTNK
jgi:hypothetical protein